MSITIYNPNGLMGVAMSLQGLDGILSVKEWPDFLDPTDEVEFTKWRASLTPLAWEKYLVPVIVEGREQDYALNLLTTDGITSHLKNISFAAQASLQPLAQILSLGNVVIAAVYRADTAVAGDAFVATARKAPSAATIVGNQVDIPTNFITTDAQGTWTNVGLYGYNYAGAANATTTAGTGTLKTHSLFTYSKGATAVTIDYIFVLNN